MKLTTFTLFKNTPFINMQNTVHFESNQERDNYFTSQYETMTLSLAFNFRKDRGVLHISKLYEELIGYNYCKFVDGFDGKTYYAFIIGMSYLNDGTTKLDILIDVIMTYTQGNVLETIGAVDVKRSHLTKINYQNRLEMLRTNDDIPSTTTQRYVKTISELFGETYVLLQCTVDLKEDFGTEKKPTMKTSTGATFDYVTSPVNLYVIDRLNFTEFTLNMKKYPWIMQNVTKCTVVPKKFISDGALQQITTSSGFTKIYKLRNNTTSTNIESEISYTKDEIMDLFGLDPNQEPHLLKQGIGTIELTDYRGQTMAFDLGKIEQLRLKYNIIVGYVNEIRVTAIGYGDRTLNGQGFHFNFSLGFDNFDELPILINNYDLAKAKSAYSRELGNSRTISGRLNQITNSNSNVEDRIFNSLSVFSDVFSGGLVGAPSKATGLFANEYEHYREQNAQLKEMALSTPTITNQSTGNSFLLKQHAWGLHLKISKVSDAELSKVRQYYNLFGFEINAKDFITVSSNQRCNWLQFTGNWVLDNVDVESMNILKNLLEGGVRFWHYRNGQYGKNPMRFDYLDRNEIIK